MAVNETAMGYSGAAGAYEAGRPSYPAPLIAALPLEAARVIVDMGAGTGKFTRLLLAHRSKDAAVIAVEPVAEMAEKLAALPGVEVRARAASDTGLADGAADLVACAQAFHWFDDAGSVAEIARILRPGGTLALIWNMRDDRVPWVAALSRLIDGYAGATPRHQTGHWTWILKDPRFHLARELVEGNPHRMPRDGLFARVLSTSYIARLPEAEKARLQARIAALLEDHGLGTAEEITLPYVSRLYLLTRV